MISFLKLIRYKNLLMVLLTLVLTKYAIIDSLISTISDFQFILLVISILCITAGGYVINDVFDIEADKINKPSKVYIGVSISKKKALVSYFMLTIIGLIIGIYVSFLKEHIAYSLFFIYNRNWIALLVFKNIKKNCCIRKFSDFFFNCTYHFYSLCF